MIRANKLSAFRFFASLIANSPRITSAIKSVLRIPLLTVFSVLLSLPATSAGAAETVEITTGEYAPWTSESLKHGGFSTHIITEAFKLEGYEVNFTFYPWKRVYEAAKDGKRFHASSWW